MYVYKWQNILKITASKLERKQTEGCLTKNISIHQNGSK